jgi:hypothetical protein
MAASVQVKTKREDLTRQNTGTRDELAAYGSSREDAGD